MAIDVFILAAGLGTRLRPLTETVPKPLVEVAGKPLIEWNIELLQRNGFSRIIVNSFYLKNVLRQYLESRFGDSLDIVLVEEEELLGTGGGIKNIKKFLRNDNLLTINSDVVIDPKFDLNSFVKDHLEAGEERIATMLLRPDVNAASYGTIGVSRELKVVEFLQEKFREVDPDERLMYTGVQVLSKEVFNFMPEVSVFSITQDVYPKLLAEGREVGASKYTGYWNDAGTHERLAEADTYLRNASEPLG